MRSWLVFVLCKNEQCNFLRGKNQTFPEPVFFLSFRPVAARSECGQALFRPLPGLFQSKSWARAPQGAAAAAARCLAVFFGVALYGQGCAGFGGVLLLCVLAGCVPVAGHAGMLTQQPWRPVCTQLCVFYLSSCRCSVEMGYRAHFI